MTSIQLDNVSFSYPNGFKAVENVNITVAKGERVAIIGQNGAGKTTTVKLMNGLLRPQDGRVLVKGEDIKDKTTAQVSQGVGYVFQNPGDQLFNNTVFDEIAYTLRHRKVDEAVIKKTVEHAAKLCHVDEYLNINPYDLPIGLRKFVTVAIVVANDCETIILDEPTAGQDLFGIQWLIEIMDYLSNEGKTVITITHDMDFVIEHFKRVIVMAHKNVIGDGTTNEVFWNHALLEEAALKQPVIAELAHRLGCTEPVVDIAEFLAAYKAE